MRRAIAAAGSIVSALGIFFRFQIPDFDFFLGPFGFFSLCHFQFLLSLVSFSYVEVFENCSGEEQPSFIPVRVGSGIF